MSKKTYMRTATGEVFETSMPQYHADCENLGSGAKAHAARQDYARAELRKIIKPKQTVFCVLRNVSSSGMSRTISLFIVTNAKRGAPSTLRNIDALAADATGYDLNPKGLGIRIGECGMDMGFALVYALGAAMWPKGTRTAHGNRNGEPDKTGGYALKSEWI